jgi:hypothetical protein
LLCSKATWLNLELKTWPKQPQARNTKGGSITVLLISCLTGLD